MTQPTAQHDMAASGGVAVHAWTDLAWVPMVLGDVVLPGFHWQSLGRDEAGGWDAYWMRVDPGARSPEHVHPATELLHIHQGSLWDGQALCLRAGDVAVFAAGSRHHTHSAEGCIALVVTGQQASVTEGPGTPGARASPTPD